LGQNKGEKALIAGSLLELNGKRAYFTVGYQGLAFSASLRAVYYKAVKTGITFIFLCAMQTIIAAHATKSNRLLLCDNQDLALSASLGKDYTCIINYMLPPLDILDLVTSCLSRILPIGLRNWLSLSIFSRTDRVILPGKRIF
jgi:hypothetical protein